ncbi:grpb/dephospho-CoA kinase [Xylariales sp. AK1849]|nr:grpb/dephospho-CoA kinase [Xylariales sp. AK1849]
MWTFDISDVKIVSIRPKRPQELVEPNPERTSNVILITQHMRAALSSRQLAIKHVGSTSVPNLPAKDVIDIDLVIIDPSAEDAYVPNLEDAGFRFLFQEPG